MKKILILHGFESDPKDHWFQEAKKRFQKKGYQVFMPKMHGGFLPKQKEWVAQINKFSPDKDWILIGHSLGGVAILRYLEKADQKVQQAILIATPYDSMEFGAIENFFKPELIWSKIKIKANKIDIVNEEDDPAIPLEHGRKYAQKLTGKLSVLPGCTHFHTLDLDFLERLIK